MALPVTITGISTAVAPVGPFKIAAGTYVATAIDISAVSPAAGTGVRGGTDSFAAPGQSFTTVGAITVPSVVGYFYKTGSPTDNIVAEITTAFPTGTVIATSNPVVASTVTATGFSSTQAVTFTFPSPPTLSAATVYGLAFRRTQSTADLSNLVLLGVGASVYAGGNSWTYSGATSAWTSGANEHKVAIHSSTTIASDAYYFFGRDGTTGTTLQAYKASDPSASGIDTNTDLSSSIGIGQSSSQPRLAQSFTTVDAFSFNSAVVHLFKTGSPTDNVVADLYASSAGMPTGTSLGQATVVAASDIPATTTATTFTWPTPISLSAATQYCLVMSRSGTLGTTNVIGWRRQTVTSYAGGFGSQDNSGGTWAAVGTTDFQLRIAGWGSIATKTGFTTAILNLAGYQPVAGVSSIDTGASTATFAFTGTGTSVAQAQSFTNGSGTLTIPSVAVNFGAATGTPTGNVYAEITDTNYAGSVLATSNQIAAPTGVSTLTFTFSSPPTIAANATFGVVLRRTVGDASNYPRPAGTVGASTYAGGTNASFNGTTWTTALADLAIVVQNSAVLGLSPVIHLAVQDGTLASSVATKYVSFDATTDTFLATTETVLAAGAIAGQATAGWGCSLAVRSTGEVVLFYNCVATNTSGTARARVAYRRRTGVNTYAAEVRVDANAAFDNTTPEVVLGANDRIHFAWLNSTTNIMHRVLNSVNTLLAASTGQNTTFGNVSYISSVSYNDAGTRKVVLHRGAKTVYFDSADAPTLNLSSASISDYQPNSLFVDGTDVWTLNNNVSQDLQVAKSTNAGSTFGSPVTAMAATVGVDKEALSRDGLVYQRGNSVVIPYIVNDNGTLKYNEYQVRYVPPPFVGYVDPLHSQLTGADGLDFGWSSASAEQLAQSITVPSGTTWTVDKCQIKMTASSPSDEVVVDIRSGSPTGTLIGTSTNTVSGSIVVSTASFVEFTFSSLALPAGTYCFIVRRTGTLNNTNAYSVVAAFPSAYSGGIVSLYISAAWNSTAFANYDFAMEIGGTSATAGYTLTAGTGGVTTAGQAVTLRRSRVMAAATGTATTAGQPVGVRKGYSMAAGTGAVTSAGKAATLARSRVMPAAKGAVTTAGIDAGLIYGSPNRVMPVATGAVTSAGNPVALRIARKLPAGTGVVVSAGQPAILRRTRTMPAATGLLAYSGQPVVLTYDAVGGGPWTPAELGTDLIAWYDFNDTATVIQSGGFLTQWNDKSGNARHGVPPNTSALSINSDGIYLANATSGAGLGIQMPTLPSVYFDCAFAGKPNAAGSYRTLIAQQVGGQHHVLIETATNVLGSYAGTGLFQAGSLTWSSVNGQIYLSFSSASTVKIGKDGDSLFDETGENLVPDSAPFLMNYGVAGGQGWGTVREFVFMTAGRSQSDQDKVSGYLAWKWDGILGVTTHVAALPSGHPYKGAPPTTGAPVTHYTMPAGTGAVTSAGQPVTFLRTRVMPAATGTVTTAGQAVALRAARKLVVATGAVTTAGQPVGLRSGRNLLAATGAVTTAGQAVALRTARKLVAGTGAVTITGLSVTLVAADNEIMTAATAPVTTAGQPVTFLRTRVMPVTAGAVTTAGQPVGLRVGRKLVAGTGAVTTAGQPAILRYGHNLVAGTGAVTTAGQPVTFRYTRVMPAGVGAVAAAGQVVNLRYSADQNTNMLVSTGAVTTAGQPVTLRRTRIMAAATGAVTTAGQAAALRRTRVMPAATGAVTTAGQPVGLRVGRKLVAGTGTVTTAGQPVTFRRTRVMAAGKGAVTITGYAATLIYADNQIMGANPVNFALTGQAVTLRAARKLAVTKGAVTTAGNAVALRVSRKLAVGTGAVTVTGQPVNLTVVTAGTVLTPEFFTNENAFYLHDITGRYVVTPAFYADPDSFYTQTATSIYNVRPAFHTDPDTFYPHIVKSFQNLLPELFANANIFYSPTISYDQFIEPLLFADPDIFQLHLISLFYGDTEVLCVPYENRRMGLGADTRGMIAPRELRAMEALPLEGAVEYLTRIARAEDKSMEVLGEHDTMVASPRGRKRR